MKNTDDVVITFGFGSTVHDNKSGNVHLIFNDTKCSVSHVTVYVFVVRCVCGILAIPKNSCGGKKNTNDRSDTPSLCNDETLHTTLLYERSQRLALLPASSLKLSLKQVI